MSKITLREIAGKDGQPVNFPTGFTIGPGSAGQINNIGIPGQQGFGLGICPGPLPAGMSEMDGTRNITSDNYGNYQYSDGSIMVWIPAFFHKWGTGANGLVLNAVDIKPFSHFASLGAANASGYAPHRAFYDAGAIQPGFFRDKYACINNGGIASSIRNRSPLSSGADHSPFSGLIGAPANAYYGAVDAAKTRGSSFFVASIFIRAAVAMLSYAHARAATSTLYCDWYDPSGVANHPKGSNNNALGDANDGVLSFVSDGYSNCSKTGSANFFARTTHNGQSSGITDISGPIWLICPGLSSDGVNLYLLKTSAQMKAMTSGNAVATDLWGAAGLAANYDNMGATLGAAIGRNGVANFGSAAQVFSDDVSGVGWQSVGAGIPLPGGIGGSNAFGNDGLWDFRPGEMCPLSSGGWGDGSNAGPWALPLDTARSNSSGNVGFASALYL